MVSQIKLLCTIDTDLIAYLFSLGASVADLVDEFWNQMSSKNFLFGPLPFVSPVHKQRNWYVYIHSIIDLCIRYDSSLSLSLSADGVSLPIAMMRVFANLTQLV